MLSIFTCRMLRADGKFTSSGISHSIESVAMSLSTFEQQSRAFAGDELGGLWPSLRRHTHGPIEESSQWRTTNDAAGPSV